MAIKIFNGFDCGPQRTDHFIVNSVATQTWKAASGWQVPPWIFHNRGLATLDATIDPPGPPSTSTRSLIVTITSGFGGWFYGPSPLQAYGVATTTTRATWATAQGHQLAVARSLVPGGLAADEYWFSFSLLMPNFNAANLDTGHEPSADWGAILRWGDVQIRMKSATPNGSLYSVVFAVRNNGSEVATVTVPNLSATTASSTNSWIWCMVRIKLHATTGAVEFYANGNAMSVAYENQNTVVTTSNASEPGIYFGPSVLDNGTNAYVGFIDHFMIDDARWPDGVTSVAFWPVASDGTLTNAAAVGTSPTTVTNAIATGTVASYNDAKALRFSAVNGRAELNMTAPSTTGMGTQVMGFFGIHQRATSRNATGPRRVKTIVRVGGVDYADLQSVTRVLPFGSAGTPPDTTGITVDWLVDKSGSPFTTSELASAQLVIESVTA